MKLHLYKQNNIFILDEWILPGAQRKSKFEIPTSYFPIEAFA